MSSVGGGSLSESVRECEALMGALQFASCRALAQHALAQHTQHPQHNTTNEEDKEDKEDKQSAGGVSNANDANDANDADAVFSHFVMASLAMVEGVTAFR